MTADVTGLLQAWSGGDAEALDQLAPLVQRELREIARRMLSSERQAGGWQPTDLVQESYVRLLDWHAVHWQNRAHFGDTVAMNSRKMRSTIRAFVRHDLPLASRHRSAVQRLDDPIAVAEAAG